MPLLTITKRNYVNGIRNTTIMIVFILIVAGIYSFSQYQKYSLAQTALAQESDQVQKMQQDTNTLSAKYLDVKKTFDSKFAQVLDALQYVMPPTESYENLARLFDQFAQDNNLPSNPFFISDLKFGVSYPDPQKDFAVLPLTMTISTTHDNFLKFLKFIESSGMLEDKTRLMEVRSISINFVNNNDNGSSGTASVSAANPVNPAATSPTLLNVSVALNAYFEKTTSTPQK